MLWGKAIQRQYVSFKTGPIHKKQRKWKGWQDGVTKQQKQLQNHHQSVCVGPVHTGRGPAECGVSSWALTCCCPATFAVWSSSSASGWCRRSGGRPFCSPGEIIKGRVCLCVITSWFTLKCGAAFSFNIKFKYMLTKEVSHSSLLPRTRFPMVMWKYVLPLLQLEILVKGWVVRMSWGKYHRN